MTTHSVKYNCNNIGHSEPIIEPVLVWEILTRSFTPVITGQYRHTSFENKMIVHTPNYIAFANHLHIAWINVSQKCTKLRKAISKHKNLLIQIYQNVQTAYQRNMSYPGSYHDDMGTTSFVWLAKFLNTIHLSSWHFRVSLLMSLLNI